MTTGPSEDHVEETIEDIEELSWPFGFIAVLALAGLYLLWRFVELGIRFFEWVF